MVNLPEEQLAARQRLRIEGNSNLRLYAKESPHHDREWDFQCECGAATCNEQVPLTIFLYEELRASDEFLLAEGHPLQRTEQARGWLRELREKAA